jgi:hypothetical protein
MSCDNCPQKDNHRYVWGKKLAGFSGDTTSAFAFLDDKLKDESQCQIIARFSIDMTEVLIECCRATGLTQEDADAWHMDEAAIWTEAEARAYISANIADWETPEE